MAPAVLTVEIVSRNGGTAWEGEASQVSVPLDDGEMGILPGHQPVLALLGTGTVRLTTVQGAPVEVPVARGFCSVDHNMITVAADLAGAEIATAGAAGVGVSSAGAAGAGEPSGTTMSAE
ncbi:F0F1 ATP synthase subunit epsilon [Actinomyces sp. zg328]|uniref:F0F1 ATP synthase subunit epsilon n=1 Tax=Actinomyces sp. zg328 TaxID=2609287 RepID=UPI00135902CC|nr:F0F1 ATP synthase subunit epsilon [Actinomyces sp. zg328]